MYFAPEPDWESIKSPNCKTGRSVIGALFKAAADRGKIKLVV